MNRSRKEPEVVLNQRQLQYMRRVHEFFVSKRGKPYESPTYKTPASKSLSVAELVNDKKLRQMFVRELSNLLNQGDDDYIYKVDFVDSKNTIPYLKVTRFRVSKPS